VAAIEDDGTGPLRRWSRSDHCDRSRPVGRSRSSRPAAIALVSMGASRAYSLIPMEIAYSGSSDSSDSFSARLCSASGAAAGDAQQPCRRRLVPAGALEGRVEQVVFEVVETEPDEQSPARTCGPVSNKATWRRRFPLAARMTALSSAFSNSRTLPGMVCARAPHARACQLGRWYPRFCRSSSASGITSSRRSRSGGTSMTNTLSGNRSLRGTPLAHGCSQIRLVAQSPEHRSFASPRSQGRELARLEEAKQLHLDGGSDLADLVKESVPLQRMPEGRSCARTRR